MDANLAVAVLIFALLFVLQKRGALGSGHAANAGGKGAGGGRGGKALPWWVIIGLAVIAAANFAASGFGGGTADALGGALGLFGEGTFLAGAGMVVMVVMVAIDVGRDHKADKPAIIAVVILALLFSVANGPIADGGERLTSNIAGVTNDAVGNLIGA